MLIDLAPKEIAATIDALCAARTLHLARGLAVGVLDLAVEKMRMAKANEETPYSTTWVAQNHIEI